MHLSATKFCCIKTQPNIKWRNCFISISQRIIFGFRINNMVNYGRSYEREFKDCNEKQYIGQAIKVKGVVLPSLCALVQCMNTGEGSYILCWM